MTGVKSSVLLDEALSATHKFREENFELKGLVNTLMGQHQEMREQLDNLLSAQHVRYNQVEDFDDEEEAAAAVKQ